MKLSWREFVATLTPKEYEDALFEDLVNYFDRHCVIGSVKLKRAC